METLHRLAGITSTADGTAQPSQIVPGPSQHNHEPTTASAQISSPNLTHSASRASLPLNRQPSRRSLRTDSQSRSRSRHRGTPGDGDTAPPPPPLPHSPTLQNSQQQQDSDSDDDEEGDFAWGPTHPCFPHPNPHCAPTSAEFGATRVIRVRRDWLQLGDLGPQYANLYPEILDPLVTDDEFRALVAALNARLRAANDPFANPSRAGLDALLAVLTGFLWEDLGLSATKSAVRGLERFVDGWNARKRDEGKEVRLVQLRKTGFMSLDFVIPDPGIDVAVQPLGREGGEGEEGEGGIGPAE